jgi:hypothetical protein
LSYYQQQITLPSDLEIKDHYSSDYKGFLFEMQVIQQLMIIPHIILDTNPTDYDDWKHLKHKRSYDICVTYCDKSKEFIECKYRKNGGKVYYSWYMDDWAPRDCNRYTTNNVEAISYSNKRDMDSKKRKLSSISETTVAISQKANKIHKKVVGCNQLSSWNNLLSNIINYFQGLSSNISSKISNFKLKVKLKNNSIKKLASVKYGLYKSTVFTKQIGSSDFMNKNPTSRLFSIETLADDGVANNDSLFTL